MKGQYLNSAEKARSERTSQGGQLWLSKRDELYIGFIFSGEDWIGLEYPKIGALRLFVQCTTI